MLRVSKFSSRWISNYGMSIGIGDVTPQKELLVDK
jgi:DNA-directed RNA polymerase III subunit RPC1